MSEPIIVPIPAHLLSIMVSAPSGAAPRPLLMLSDISRYIEFVPTPPSLNPCMVQVAIARLLFTDRQDELVLRLKQGERLPVWNRFASGMLRGVMIAAKDYDIDFSVSVENYEEFRL